jgi:hypothetical protein
MLWSTRSGTCDGQPGQVRPNDAPSFASHPDRRG